MNLSAEQSSAPVHGAKHAHTPPEHVPESEQSKSVAHEPLLGGGPGGGGTKAVLTQRPDSLAKTRGSLAAPHAGIGANTSLAATARGEPHA